MLKAFEMELVVRQNFYDFFEEHRYNSDDGDLMYRMEAFDKVTVNYVVQCMKYMCSVRCLS